LLSKLNINESEFAEKANSLLMKDYTDFDKKIGALIEKMSKNKGAKDIFAFIEHEDFDKLLKVFN
jgi:hypothetical protein